MGTLKRMKEFSVGSTFILGEPLTGRTSWVIEQLKGKKVLWLAFSNVGVVSETELLGEGSELAQINDLKTDVPVVTKEQGFDYIVLDGFSQFISLWITANLGTVQPTQQDWGRLSTAAKKLILDFRAIAPVYCVMDIEKDAEGQNQVAANRATYQGIVGLFDRKVRTAFKRELKLDAKTQAKSYVSSYVTFTGAEALSI